jgi:hypothetical protein
MSTSKNKAPAKLETELEGMIGGLSNTGFTLLSSMMILGASLSKAEVIVKLKAYLQLITAVDAARQAYLAAVVARKAKAADTHAFLEGLVTLVKQAVGPTNQGQLATFGILPPAPRKAPTPETKAQAKLKAAATRQARGTKGKRQKLAIKASPAVAQPGAGVGAGPNVPATSSAPLAPAAAETPAPSPSSTPSAAAGSNHTP